jgi:NitT/TauT family transport system substrate-binding protein
MVKSVYASMFALVALFAASNDPVRAQNAPLKIVMASTPSYTWLPFLVAQKVTFDDLKKQIGRDIEVTYAPTTTPAVLGLIAGDYDFGIAYVQHAIKAEAEGKDLVVLMALMDNPSAAIVVRSDLDNIKTLKDLKGTSMGVVGIGSGHQMIGIAAAKSAGLQPDDVTYRSVGGIAGLIPAMRSKRVDEVVASEPTLTKLLQEKLGRVLIDFHSKEATQQVFHGPHPTVALLARREYAEAHPQLTQAVVQSLVNTLKWIHTHSPSDIAATLPEDIQKQGDSDSILARVLPAVSVTGQTKPEAVALAIELMKDMGEVDKNARIDPNAVIDEKFLAAVGH